MSPLALSIPPYDQPDPLGLLPGVHVDAGLSADTGHQHDQAGVSDPQGSSHPTVWPPSSRITGVHHHSQSKEVENLFIKYLKGNFKETVALDGF